MKRRFATRKLLLPTGESLSMQIVEVEEGKAVRYYPLQSEQEDTWWVQGDITIHPDGTLTIPGYYQPCGE